MYINKPVTAPLDESLTLPNVGNIFEKSDRKNRYELKNLPGGEIRVSRWGSFLKKLWTFIDENCRHFVTNVIFSKKSVMVFDYVINQNQEAQFQSQTVLISCSSKW